MTCRPRRTESEEKNEKEKNEKHKHSAYQSKYDINNSDE
jgi:hypothetical protein